MADSPTPQFSSFTGRRIRPYSLHVDLGELQLVAAALAHYQDDKVPSGDPDYAKLEQLHRQCQDLLPDDA